MEMQETTAVEGTTKYNLPLSRKDALRAYKVQQEIQEEMIRRDDGDMSKFNPQTKEGQ